MDLSSPDDRPRVDVSVVIPCLDEIDGVGRVVADARQGLHLARLAGEIIVVDNGSTDGSAAAAARSGAQVYVEPRRGYGSAIRRGLAVARGDIIVIVDADRSYDLVEVGELVQRVANGADLVVGTRFANGIDAGAMPWLHRHVGTPVLNLLLALSTGRRFQDSQSGYRVFRRDRLTALAFQAEGMEFASEMLVRADRAGLRIEEVPVRYRRRVGSSKLRPFRDGLRHCRLVIGIHREGATTRNTRNRSSS